MTVEIGGCNAKLWQAIACFGRLKKHSRSAVNQTSRRPQDAGADARAKCNVRIAALGAVTICLASVLFLALTPSCFAQGSTSVLGGKVFDPQGKVIQNATVTVISDETAVQWSAKTNEAGNWRVDALVAGHYHFNVSAPGFTVMEYPSFELQMASQKFMDVVLEVGHSTVSVTVKDISPLIDTTAAVSGTVLENGDFERLPSMSNSVTEFLGLTPGVVNTNIGSSIGVYLWSNIALSSSSANGAGSGNNALNYVIDGATNSINSTGQMAFVPPIDSIQEVRVTINAYDASIDRTAAGTVNMTMKSGGKQFHGNLYERNQNNFMNANYYQYKNAGKALPKVRHNEYGGTFGGPVWIPKLYNGREKRTFFFFDYNGIRDISPYGTGTLSLPNSTERTGDLSQSFTTATVGGVTTQYFLKVYDPATAISSGERTQFTNSVVPSGRLSGFAKAILNLLPLPNKTADSAGTDSNNYLEDDPQFDKFYSYSIRLDEAWNNNHHSYLEFRHNNFWQIAANPFGRDNILAGQYLTRINNGLTLNHAWAISPKLFANLTGNATIWRTTQRPPTDGMDPTKFGFSSQLASEQTVKGVPALSGMWGQDVGDWGPSYEYDYQFEGKGYLQQTWKNHTFRYGGVFMRAQEAIGSLSDGAGLYTFSNIWTTENPNTTAGTGVGSTFASYLLGMPSGGKEIDNATAYYSQPYAGVYVQDDWRATPRLTLNFGVRYDYQFELTERHNRYYSRFDPDYNLTAITDYAQPAYASLISGSSSSLGVQLLQAQRSDASTFIAKGAILYAGVNGASRSISDTQPKYVQPRIGFAYLIHPDTVLRGGFGRFTQGTFIAGHANQLGYTSTTTFDASDDNFITQSSTLENPYPTGLVAKTGNSLGVYTSPGNISSFYTPNTKRQYTDDFSLHLQQEIRDYLFEIGGVYEHTYGLGVGHQVNQPSVATAKAAYDPVFDSNGRPIDTLPGDVQVTNPFKGAPYITNSFETNTKISAYQLLRPNPLISNGGLTEYFYNGKSDHYALQSKLQRRFRNGFGATWSFSWGKQMDTTAFMTNSTIAQKLHRQLSTSDVRFQNVIASNYVLPFGRGKLFVNNSGSLVNNLIGGWEVSGYFVFYSGTPLSLPTNSAFFQGGDPGLGSKKTQKQWFDTSKFVALPSRSTTYAQLHNPSMYPSWTGVSSLPGYDWSPTSSSDSTKNGVYQDFRMWSTDNPTTFGDVRNPYKNMLNLGLRKTIQIKGDMNVQLFFDAFNALNHPQFGSIGTTAGSTYFGYLNGSNTLSQANLPRTIQLSGKFYF